MRWVWRKPGGREDRGGATWWQYHSGGREVNLTKHRPHDSVSSQILYIISYLISICWLIFFLIFYMHFCLDDWTFCWHSKHRNVMWPWLLTRRQWKPADGGLLRFNIGECLLFSNSDEWGQAEETFQSTSNYNNNQKNWQSWRHFRGLLIATAKMHVVISPCEHP